ncbi:osmoprotectant transport system ATP-binding protein [Hypnocyclicus thermotrophus]|uniref:Osmoprotectant transport system ATP-binding protein n=1 Tax=Hypnocyclicus thermotrophus TaxID=1627895 RepID=A0AA46DZ66_9FUSO|nr:betaine/proline/choline family ABC transporter ATP-binding protein [Hypnocyclicus thermotrophus]TDT71573.1 osmoprotectant transport system ATP-binding protein [Hypnocyclicus thermotrophus]
MIEFKKVSKTFDGKKNVINKLNFKINKGELVVLIGESGCGKTTTMRMINLLIKPTKGEILIDGKNILKMNKIQLRRNIGYVIQKVGLLPHMTIGENIELLPKIKKWKKEKRVERAKELLELVELDPEEYYDRYPNELSGGQQQRIGIARALAADPDIILMDEPFSALDPITREKLQDEIIRIQDELHKTIIFVTHDMDEAIKIADRIAVMNNGEIVQYDTPEEILKNPINDFVEFFIGKERLWRQPELVLAKDIMRKKVYKINAEGKMARAVEKLKESEATMLIVVDKIKDKPQKGLGLITPKLLKRIEFNKKTLNYNTKVIKDYMRKDFVTVDEKTNMVQVLNYMSTRNFRSIPVTNSKNEIVGIITPNSILNIMSKISPDCIIEEEIISQNKEEVNGKA